MYSKGLFKSEDIFTAQCSLLTQWYWACKEHCIKFCVYIYNLLYRVEKQAGKLLCERTVTVTEALVLRLLLEGRGHITESIRILVPVDRMKQKCFQIATKRVRRSQQFQLCWLPVSCLQYSNRKCVCVLWSVSVSMC